MGITVCFLLYSFQQPEARNFVTIAVILAAFFQIFTACAIGEMIKIENETVRDQLYALNWEDYDLDTKKYLLFLFVTNVPDATIKIGFFFTLKLESFTMVNIASEVIYCSFSFLFFIPVY